MVTDSQVEFNHDLGQLLGAMCAVIKSLREGWTLGDEDYELLVTAANAMCNRADDMLPHNESSGTLN